MPTARHSPERVAFGALGLGLVLGAIGPTILRSAESTGLLFAAWRMLAGALLYAAVMRVRGTHVTLRMLRDSAVGGAFFGLSLGLFYLAVVRTSVANAMVIGALRPAIVVAVVGPLMHERVTLRTAVWTTVAIGGAAFSVIAAADGGGASLDGDLIALVGMFASTGYLLAAKRGRRDYESFSFTTAMMVSGAAVLFPLALITGEGVGLPPAADWKWILAMAIIPGFGHVLNNYSLAHLPLTVVSTAFLLGPGAAAAMAWLLIDERILVTDVIGMAVTIAALVLVVLSAPPSPAAATAGHQATEASVDDVSDPAAETSGGGAVGDPRAQSEPGAIEPA